MNDSTATHPSSMDGKLAGVQNCEGSTAVLVSTRTEKGYFANNAREAVHASVKKACDAAVNGSAFEVFRSRRLRAAISLLMILNGFTPILTRTGAVLTALS